MRKFLRWLGHMLCRPLDAHRFLHKKTWWLKLRKEEELHLKSHEENYLNIFISEYRQIKQNLEKQWKLKSIYVITTRRLVCMRRLRVRYRGKHYNIPMFGWSKCSENIFSTKASFFKMRKTTSLMEVGKISYISGIPSLLSPLYPPNPPNPHPLIIPPSHHHWIPTPHPYLPPQCFVR